MPTQLYLHDSDDLDPLLHWVHRSTRSPRTSGKAFGESTNEQIYEAHIKRLVKTAKAHLKGPPPSNQFLGCSITELSTTPSSASGPPSASDIESLEASTRAGSGDQQSILGSQTLCASYMMAYPGRLGVITLGTTPELSSRLNEGTDSLARLAVLQIAEQIQLDFIAQQSVGVEAVQLVAESQNTAQLAILQLAGFEHLATLYQMGCNLRELDSTTTSPDYMTLKTSIETTSTTSQGLHFALVHPTQVDVARLTRLVSETFIDTLDCPRMSDIRSDDATVESYLDGATADRTAEPLPWIVAVENSKWVGCVLLNRTHPGIAELAYVGVIPSARHRGLGRRLVQLGCRMAIDHGIEQTWLAVDANNAAAMRLYRKPRFATLRKVDAWFRW